MSLTKTFYDAVKANDTRKVRIMMKDSLLVDPTFELFNEMEKVASSLSNLYDVHDGRKFNLDKSTWNDDYMNKLKVQVIGNFSHERIGHLKEVIRYLRPVKNNDQKTFINSSQLNKRTTYQEQKRIDQKAGNYREVKIVSGAVIGSVVGGTVATATSISVIGGVVVGAVIGGTVVAIATVDK